MSPQYLQESSVNSNKLSDNSPRIDLRLVIVKHSALFSLLLPPPYISCDIYHINSQSKGPLPSQLSVLDLHSSGTANGKKVAVRIVLWS